MSTLPPGIDKLRTEAGLQIWRVEKMKLNAVPKEFFGEFFSGDSYVILKTFPSSVGKAHSCNVHSWIGKNATPDEKGCVAIFIVQLDDHLEGRARQFTEFQDEESIEFMSNFPHGIRYKTGGISSGFKHGARPEMEPRLLQMQGRRQIRASEVPMEWASMNSGDCFLFDLGNSLIHWGGKDCNGFERIKTTSLAIEIRDFERGGRPELTFVDEGDEPEEIIKLLGPKPELSARSGCDIAVDRKNRSIATLYQISDAAGDMKTTLVSKKNPFQQNMLSNSDCYILDNPGNKSIFVWKGKAANSEERKAASKAANKFIKEKKYPENTKVSILPSGAETGQFKEFFLNWVDKYETTEKTVPYSAGRIAAVEQIPFDASSLHDNVEMVAQHCMVDDGSGEFQIWRVEKGDKVALDKSSYGHFYGGDCYLVQYSYSDNGKKKHIIYYWQGLKSTVDEQGASAILAIDLDDSMGGVATQVRVTQGKEPAHLVSLFKDNPMVIYLGGTSRKGDDTKPASTRLFHIRRNTTNATRAVEVEPSASSLNTNDAFVLKTPGSLMVWQGKGATPEEMKAAKYVTTLLEVSPRSITEMKETKETDAFWAALGGLKPYQNSLALQNQIHTPRLFACSNATGNLIADEVIGEISQMDLATDDVMILDCFDQLFIWIGKGANEAEKTGAPKIAQDYLKYDPSGRCGIPITTIKQGEEPLTFIGWFHAWDPKLWAKTPLQTMQELIKKPL